MRTHITNTVLRTIKRTFFIRCGKRREKNKTNVSARGYWKIVCIFCTTSQTIIPVLKFVNKP